MEFSRRDLLTGLDIDMIALNQINVLVEKFSRTILDKVLEGKHFVEIWRKKFSNNSL